MKNLAEHVHTSHEAYIHASVILTQIRRGLIEEDAYPSMRELYQDLSERAKELGTDTSDWLTLPEDFDNAILKLLVIRSNPD